MNYDLCAQLKQSCDFTRTFQYFTNKIKEMDVEINTNQKEYEQLINSSKGAIRISATILILLALYAWLLKWANSHTKDPSDYMSFVITWACVALVAFIFMFVEIFKCHSRKKRARRYKDQILEPTVIKNNKLKENLEKELEQFHINNFQKCLAFVPEDYWGQPTFSLYKIVSQGRALTLMEAINIYEQEKLIKQIKKTQRQIIDAQEEYYESMSDELTKSHREINMHLDGIENLLAYDVYLNKRRES